MATKSSQSLVGGLFQVTNAFRIFAFIYTGSVPSQPQIGMFHFCNSQRPIESLAAEQRPVILGVAVPGEAVFRTSLPPPTPSQTPKTIGLRPKPQSFALILAYFNYCFMFLKMSVPVIRSSPAVQLPEFGTPSIVLTPKVMIGMIPDPDGT